MPLLLPDEYGPEALIADVALQRAARSRLQAQLIALQEGINCQATQILSQKRRSDYTVGQFETLPIVASRFYGSPDYWPQLAKANELEFPYTIVPGQVLVIPKLEG